MRACAAIGALVSMVCVYVMTSRYGVGITPDSICYATAARSLVSEACLLTCPSGPFVYWPPLYPVLLAPFAAVGIDPLTAARWLNIILMGALVLLVDRFMLARLENRMLRCLGCLALAVSPPLLAVARYAWSELVFIALTLGSLLALERWLETPTRKSFWLAAGLALLACLTRYIGICGVITAVVVLTLRGHARRAALFALVTLGPLALWMLRNYVLASTLTGDRTRSSSGSLAQALGESLAVVSAWLWPSAVPPLGRALLTVALLATAIVRLRGTPQLRLASVHLLYAVVYVASLSALVAWTAEDPISDRYLAPIAASLILFILLAGEVCMASLDQRVVWVGLALPLLLCPAWISAGAVRSARWWGAGGYASRPWVEDPLVAYLAAHPINGEIFTNDPYALLFFDGQASRFIPPRARMREDLAPAIGAHVVWFDNALRAQRIGNATLDELTEGVTLHREGSTAGGDVYVVTATTSKPR